MKRTINGIHSLIPVVIILINAIPASAGIVVNNGIVTDYTPEGSAAQAVTTDTLKFVSGSYNDNTANIVRFASSDALSLSDDLANILSTAAQADPPTSLNVNIVYLFALTTGETSTTIQRMRTWQFTISGPQVNWYGGSFGGEATESKSASSTDTTIFYWATTAAPTVPEPSTAIAMGLLGVVGFAGNRRRRRQVSAA